MSNYVKISTIGMNAGTVDQCISYSDAVSAMKDYLYGQLSNLLPEKPDLIVMPEACDIPRNYKIEQRWEYFEARGNKILDFLAETAVQNQCNIVYNTICKSKDEKYRNSTRIIDRKGKVAGTYNKNHPVIVEFDEGVLSGKDAPIIECDFGRVACAICFDIVFDQLRLKYVKQKPDLIVYSSMFHGGMMQQYWAYSCRSYFVASTYAGKPSSIVSPVGQILSSSTEYFKYTTAIVNLDYIVVFLDYNMDNILAMKQKYGSQVKIHDPGHLGAVIRRCLFLC